MCLAAFGAALAVSFFGAPWVRLLADRYQVLDLPGPRKIHKRPIPRWGGFAIYAGLLAGVGALFIFPRFRTLLSYVHPILDKKTLKTVETLAIDGQLTGMLIGATLAMLLGAVDDKKGVAAFPKLLIQIIAALVVMQYGVRIFGISFPLVGEFIGLTRGASIVLTTLWLVGFMNTVNLLDGLDGLATGVVALAAGTFLVVSVIQADTQVVFIRKQLLLAVLISAALMGSALGFLYHNFYPAKIFMGDSGSQFLGFMLGAITVIGTLKTTAAIAFFIPVMVVALPVLDVALSIVRRLLKKRPVMQPDKEHLHHRLLALGWSQRETVLLVYLLTGALGVLAILWTVFKGFPGP